MSTKTSGRLTIPQWSILSRTVTANDIVQDEYGAEVSRSRTDLTGAVVYFTVEDASGTTVIQKTSANVLEIVILDQIDPLTRGQADILFTESDTGALVAGDEYWFDCWTANVSGGQGPIVDRGRFIVCESVTHISAGPAPSIPTFPVAQTPQERSFRWVVPVDGDDFTITVPGGMVSNEYHVGATMVTLPLGGSSAIILVDETLQTSTEFNLKTSGLILAGTAYTFHLRGI